MFNWLKNKVEPPNYPPNLPKEKESSALVNEVSSAHGVKELRQECENEPKTDISILEAKNKELERRTGELEQNTHYLDESTGISYNVRRLVAALNVQRERTDKLEAQLAQINGNTQRRLCKLEKPKVRQATKPRVKHD